MVRRVLSSASIDVRVRLEARRFPLARNLGRESQPGAAAVEWRNSDAWNGVRSVTNARNPASDDRAGQALRRAHLSLDRGQAGFARRVLRFPRTRHER